MKPEAWKLISLPKIGDDRGLLGIVEGARHIPFDIKRIFYLYDVPENKSRGAHAHKALHQFIVSFGDGFEVELDNGKTKQRFHLNKASVGLYVPPLTWTHVENFKNNSVCLVLASAYYEEADYLRNYDDFLQAVG